MRIKKWIQVAGIRYQYKKSTQSQIPINSQMKFKDFIYSKVKKAKYLGMNLTKKYNISRHALTHIHTHAESHTKSLLKKPRHASKWRNIPCSWIRTLIIKRCWVFPNGSIDLMQSQTKSQEVFFVALHKLILGEVGREQAAYSTKYLTYYEPTINKKCDIGLNIDKPVRHK